MIWWEDFKVGDSVEMGRHSFTAQEIVDFARRFDPQPFHVDAAAAETSFFGGLIASGWHTCSVGMRLMCESYLNRSKSLGAPVLATRASSTRPGVGLVKHRWEALNQKGELVLTMEGWGMFGRRP